MGVSPPAAVILSSRRGPRYPLQVLAAGGGCGLSTTIANPKQPITTPAAPAARLYQSACHRLAFICYR